MQILVYPYYRWVVRRHCSRFAVKSEAIWLKRCFDWKCKESKVNESTAEIVSGIIKKKGISVIHTNTSVVNIGAMIKQRLGEEVKHIWHIREFGDADFDMYPLVGRKLFFEYMNANADTFICISKSIEKHYSGLLKDKKVVVYNGIDKTNSIVELEDHSGVNFLISGRISETKGQKEAVQACIKLLIQDTRTSGFISRVRERFIFRFRQSIGSILCFWDK